MCEASTRSMLFDIETSAPTHTPGVIIFTVGSFEKVVSHVSNLVKNGKAQCMNMHDYVDYDTVKSIHDDYIRNISAIFN